MASTDVLHDIGESLKFLKSWTYEPHILNLQYAYLILTVNIL